MSVNVGLVIVSHSASLASGVVELAGQMAPEVPLFAAGGMADGGLGTDFDAIQNAVEQCLECVGEGDATGVVILTDLGSATMTTESVIEFADDPDRLMLVDAPLVEGAIAAAVRAQVGDSLIQVRDAALTAGRQWSSVQPCAHEGESASTDGVLSAEVIVADPEGLHARPAALIARLAAGFDAECSVNGADAASVLELMTLGARQGESVRVTATGAEAQVALEALVHQIGNPS